MLFRYLGSAALLLIGLCSRSVELDSQAKETWIRRSGSEANRQQISPASCSTTRSGILLCCPDGRILVVGTTSSGFPTERDAAVVVFGPDGSVDQTFGQAGRVLIDQGGNEFCYAVACADGRPDSPRRLPNAARLAAPLSLWSCVSMLTGPSTARSGTRALCSRPSVRSCRSGPVVRWAIIAAGTRPSPSGGDFAIACLTSAGILNPAFGQAGVDDPGFRCGRLSDAAVRRLERPHPGRRTEHGRRTGTVPSCWRMAPWTRPSPACGQRLISLGCSYDVVCGDPA